MSFVCLKQIHNKIFLTLSTYPLQQQQQQTAITTTTKQQSITFLDQVIYPGKVTDADTFRIGNIGHLFPADMNHLVLNFMQTTPKNLDRFININKGPFK